VPMAADAPPPPSDAGVQYRSIKGGVCRAGVAMDSEKVGNCAAGDVILVLEHVEQAGGAVRLRFEFFGQEAWASEKSKIGTLLFEKLDTEAGPSQGGEQATSGLATPEAVQPSAEPAAEPETELAAEAEAEVGGQGGAAAQVETAQAAGLQPQAGAMAEASSLDQLVSGPTPTEQPPVPPAPEVPVEPTDGGGSGPVDKAVAASLLQGMFDSALSKVLGESEPAPEPPVVQPAAAESTRADEESAKAEMAEAEATVVPEVERAQKEGVDTADTSPEPELEPAPEPEPELEPAPGHSPAPVPAPANPEPASSDDDDDDDDDGYNDDEFEELDESANMSSIQPAASVADDDALVWTSALQPPKWPDVTVNHGNAVSVCRVVAQGQALLTGTKRGEMTLWALPSGVELCTAHAHIGRVSDCQVWESDNPKKPRHRIISSSQDGTIAVWDMSVVDKELQKALRSQRGVGGATAAATYASWSNGGGAAKSAAAAMTADEVSTATPLPYYNVPTTESTENCWTEKHLSGHARWRTCVSERPQSRSRRRSGWRRATVSEQAVGAAWRSGRRPAKGWLPPCLSGTHLPSLSWSLRVQLQGDCS
jgi:hypothetical protein